MIDRRFVALFLITFGIVSFSGFLWWKFFYLQKNFAHHEHEHEKESAMVYEEIELTLPVQAVLKRGANSVNLSIIKRAFVNQWIYFNEQELIKLIMYAQGATSFEELKKAFEDGMQKEPNNSAISFVKGSLDTIVKDPALIEHVNNSLREGFSPQIHSLRGRLMEVEKGSKEYRKLKVEYKKALDAWIDQKHGSLLDELATQI